MSRRRPFTLRRNLAQTLFDRFDAQAAKERKEAKQPAPERGLDGLPLPQFDGYTPVTVTGQRLAREGNVNRAVEYDRRALPQFEFDYIAPFGRVNEGEPFKLAFPDGTLSDAHEKHGDYMRLVARIPVYIASYIANTEPTAVANQIRYYQVQPDTIVRVLTITAMRIYGIRPDR